MSDESEEKTLPASKRKLRKQREKGSVVTSREAVMSLTGIAALIYLYVMRVKITEKLLALWVLEPDEGQSFALQFQSKLVIVGQLGTEVVLPLLGLVIAVGVLGGMGIAGGPAFSVEPITPNFDKISPASGFKKIFARKAMMSFLMNVIRLCVLAVVFGLILLSGWQALILAPVCGMGCALETLQSVFLPIVIGAVAVMSFMTMFDYIVQRSEFMREQMMTMSEFKREMKDQMGDPHLRGQLRQERKSLMTNPTGPGFATLIIADGTKRAIGVRYVEGETPAPMIVAKVQGTPSIRAMEKKSKAFLYSDGDLTQMISGISVGGYITEDDMIAKVAPLLQQSQRG